MAGELPMHSPHWKAWRDPAIGIAREPTPHPSPLQKRLDWLAQACSLNGAQSRVLGLLARAVRTPEVRRLVEAVDDRFHVDGLELEPFLETNSERVELSARGKLSELGLIDAQDNSSLSVVVHRFLSLPRFNPRKLSDLLLGEPARASLAWKDFEHLGDSTRSRFSDCRWRWMSRRLGAAQREPPLLRATGNRQDGVREDARRPGRALRPILRRDGRRKFRAQSTRADCGASYRKRGRARGAKDSRCGR